MGSPYRDDSAPVTNGETGSNKEKRSDVLLSASDMSSKPRGVPGPAPMLTGDIPVSSVKEPLPPQYDAASASKNITDERMHHLSKSQVR